MDLICELCATLVPHRDRNTHARLHRHIPESRLLNVYQPTVPTPRQEGRCLRPSAPHHLPSTPSPPPSQLPVILRKPPSHPSFIEVGREYDGPFCHRGNRCGLKGLESPD